MSLMLRLRQQGRTNRKSYRLVVIDKKVRRDGKYIESVGHYDPHKEDGAVLDKERVMFWLQQGAQPSERTVSLLKRKCPEAVEFLAKRK